MRTANMRSFVRSLLERNRLPAISSEARKGEVERSHDYEISRFADSLEMTDMNVVVDNVFVV